MATSYNDIYQRAIFRFRDYDFMKLHDADIGSILNMYMRSAIADFAPVCEEDLWTRNDEAEEFHADLSEWVQEILASGIAYYWLSSKIMDQEVLRNSMSTKDYTFFSPANLLRESQEFRNQVRKEFRDNITKYTYRHDDIASLTENG